MQFPKKVPMTAVKKKKKVFDRNHSCHVIYDPTIIIFFTNFNLCFSSPWTNYIIVLTRFDLQKSSGKKTILKIEIPYMIELTKDCGGQ